MQNPTTPQHEMPFIGGIVATFRFLEELIANLAGPVLMVGLGISLVDLLTDGLLLNNLPALLYAWAISQAVGVDAQFASSFDRARQAWRGGRYWELASLLLLGGVLGYVCWVSAQVFALQQTYHLTTAQALAQLGLGQTSWLVQRTFLSVFLVALSGWNRYHPPVKARASLAEELLELDRQKQLAAAKMQLQEIKLRGGAHMARGLLSSLRGGEDPQGSPPENSPTGPGSPQVTPVEAADNELESEDNTGVVALPSPQKRAATRQLKPAARASVEERRRKQAFRMLAADPEMSARKLSIALNCRWGTADRYKRDFGRQQTSQSLAI